MTHSEPKTPTRLKAGERRQEILQTLATLLEQPRGEKITTALLASRLSISEAALYRHFASKAKMFECLIEFIEETLFTRINRISTEIHSGLGQVEAILSLLLAFADKNPGMTRVLTGEALLYENERLDARVNQLCDRLETSLRQSLRLATTHGEITSDRGVSVQANLLMNVVLGRWHQFTASHFRRSPTQDWDILWALLKPMTRM